MTSQIITEHNPGENTTLESSWPVLYMSSATIFIVIPLQLLVSEILMFCCVSW